MTYWTVEPPAKWQAGTFGAARTPMYFSCADCGEEDAEIAGCLSTDGTFSGVGLFPPADGRAIGYRPAMFCRECWSKRMDAVKSAA